MTRRTIGAAAAAVWMAVLLTACSAFGAGGRETDRPAPPPASEAADSSGVSATASSGAQTATPAPEEATPQAPVVTSATLLAVGDIMVHMPQVTGYYDAATDSFEVSSWFEQVEPILSRGDFVIGNLETTIAGKDLGYSGYPRFNSPKGLLNAVRGAGIEILSTANNHAMDRGFPGVQRTLQNVRAAGLTPVGTSSSLVDSERQVIVEKNGIRVGFLAYTYGTNGIPVPPEHSYAVNLIDLPAIRADIAALRRAGVDIVAVSLHFGVEYQRMPNEDQLTLVRELVAAGADVILGSHPHVVQPYQTIDIAAEDSADGQPRQGIAIYSLGNFISNQSGNWKDVGLIFGVTLTKTVWPDGTSETRWSDVTAEPTWVHIRRAGGANRYTIVPLRQSLADRTDPDLTESDYISMQSLYDGIEQHIHQLDGTSG